MLQRGPGGRWALAAPATRIVTLTVTEAGYCLDGQGALEFHHPDIVHDLEGRTLVQHSRGAVPWQERVIGPEDL